MYAPVVIMGYVDVVTPQAFLGITNAFSLDLPDLSVPISCPNLSYC